MLHLAAEKPTVLSPAVNLFLKLSRFAACFQGNEEKRTDNVESHTNEEKDKISFEFYRVPGIS